MKKILVAFLLLAIILGCNKVEVVPEHPIVLSDLDYNYDIPELDLQFDQDIVKLGRVLFYDPILSKNGKVSCGSCHKQEYAFGDNTQFSIGFEDGKTTTNTPTLLNLAFAEHFFWTGSTSDLREACNAPIFNSLEMGMTEEILVSRINAAKYYDQLIKNAYGRKNINELLICEALKQFVSAMASNNSRFDSRLNNELTEMENYGLFAFDQHCNSCHNITGEPYYAGSRDDFANIGLLRIDSISIDEYYGRPIRIPSLRNLSHTAPYMRDGRFNTLEEVLSHYNSDVQESTLGSVDSRLIDTRGRIKRNYISPYETEAIIAFLKTLDDTEILTDERFSSPFK